MSCAPTPTDLLRIIVQYTNNETEVIFIGREERDTTHHEVETALEIIVKSPTTQSRVSMIFSIYNKGWEIIRFIDATRYHHTLEIYNYDENSYIIIIKLTTSVLEVYQGRDECRYKPIHKPIIKIVLNPKRRLMLIKALQNILRIKARYNQR